MAEAPEEQKKDRVGWLPIMFMVALAILFDLISLIPFVSIIIPFIAWPIFGIWFYLLGVSPLSLKRLATAGASFVIGLIPILSMLPEITVSVAAIILMVKSEDKLGLKLPLKA